MDHTGLEDELLQASSWSLPDREANSYDPVVLALASELHTGAEIEAAFAEDREPGELDLGEVLNESVPLAVSMSESIEHLRQAGHGMRRHRAIRANRPRAGASSRLVEHPG
jgi:hypothetical protein